MRITFALLVSGLLALPCAAQYAERLDVWVANVDVVVTDRSGNPVKGLTKDDFEVFENGKKQTITNFSAFEEVTPRAATTETAEAAVPPPAPAFRPRLIVIFIDIEDIEPAVRQRFFDGVRAFLDTAIRPGDFVTVLTWNRRIRVAVPPTSIREKVDAAMQAFSLPFGRRDEAMAAALGEMKLENAAIDAALARDLGIGSEADAEADAAFQEWQRGEETCAEMRRKPRELRNMLALFSRVDMQKVLVFACDNAIMRVADQCFARDEWDRLADAANGYGMTVHAFHPPGFRDPMTAGRRTMSTITGGEDARTFKESDGLALLAERTGGVMGIGPVQTATQLVRVARELDVYYSIGYRMEGGNEDRSRELRIVTKNRKYNVRARRSIVRPSEATRARDTVVTNLYFERADMPQALPFTTRVARVTPDGRFRLAHVEVSFAARQLALVDGAGGNKRGSFTVFVAGGREFGDASEVSEMKQDFEVPAAKADEMPIVYSFAARIRPDTRRLSVALRDNTTGEIATQVIELHADGGQP